VLIFFDMVISIILKLCAKNISSITLFKAEGKLINTMSKILQDAKNSFVHLFCVFCAIVYLPRLRINCVLKFGTCVVNSLTKNRKKLKIVQSSLVL
jgi:hypothetical protein